MVVSQLFVSSFQEINPFRLIYFKRVNIKRSRLSFSTCLDEQGLKWVVQFYESFAKLPTYDMRNIDHPLLEQFDSNVCALSTLSKGVVLPDAITRYFHQHWKFIPINIKSGFNFVNWILNHIVGFSLWYWFVVCLGFPLFMGYLYHFRLNRILHNLTWG